MPWLSVLKKATRLNEALGLDEIRERESRLDYEARWARTFEIERAERETDEEE